MVLYGTNVKGEDDEDGIDVKTAQRARRLPVPADLPASRVSVRQCQSSGSVKTAQGVAMPRNSCSPSGINLVFVSAATAPEISTLRPRGRHSPSSRLTRLAAGAVAANS